MSYTEVNDPEPPNWLPLALMIAILTTLLFLTIGKAFATCTAHIEHETDFALFSNLTEAKAFSNEHEGKIISSDDGKTFTVIYTSTVVVSNLPDDCN